MNGIKDTKNETPILKDDEKMYVYLKGSHFQQNNVLTTNNKTNNIYVMGKDYIQKIHDTKIYAEKMYYRNW